MSGGMILIDLTIDEGDLNTPRADDVSRWDRTDLWSLDRIPDGVTVQVNVSGRSLVTQDFASLTHQHHERLNIVICGPDYALVKRFVDAMKSGDSRGWGQGAA